MDYPHGIHPALVPGVSIDDQRVRYGIDRPLLIGVGALILAFIIWGIVAPQHLRSVSSTALNWTVLNFGWLFNSLALGMGIFLLAIAASRYGRIPLGLDGEQREYSTLSWVAMLFGAGIGIGIIVFGPYEPLSHYLWPLPGLYEPATDAAVKGALAQTALHYGVNAWAIYAIVGLSVAYVSYRKGRVPLMSSVLQPLFGFTDRTAPGARIIDGLAIIATLFGTAASLGIGALQIGQGVKLISGWSVEANALALGIIVVLTIGTIISAVSGVAKGIRRLSTINLGLAVALAFAIFLLGPTIFLTNLVPGVLATYVSNAPAMLSATTSDGQPTIEYLSYWTTFYWAWWVSWAPFVGVFTAKISRGRTVRQFVLGVLFLPAAVTVSAYTIMGGTSIWLQRQTGSLAPGNSPDNLPPIEQTIFLVLDQLPGGHLITPLVMVLLAIFFITSSDSASIVNSQLSQGGNPEPNRLVTAFWAICMAGIAAVMLLLAGRDALQGLQNLIVVTALPFSAILILMAVALMRELRRDPMMIRDRFGKLAVDQAVRQGLEKHGDDFVLGVESAAPGSGVGTSFDTSAEEYTRWYQRTDFDGSPVEYDYETGTYADEAEPDDQPQARPGSTTES
ncbi:BCCT family transporter [Tessaracoccus sp. OH4464_COT-324]|nr:BCCT family transporter [Tessaracoccus sp. OH4464_COT-324]